MLCPKCGYISFDHLTSCAKCNKDISVLASELSGTAVKAEYGFFLGAVIAGDGLGVEAEEVASDEIIEEEPDVSSQEEDSDQVPPVEIDLSSGAQQEDILDIPSIDISGIESEEDGDSDISLDDTDVEESGGEEGTQNESPEIEMAEVALPELDLSEVEEPAEPQLAEFEPGPIEMPTMEEDQGIELDLSLDMPGESAPEEAADETPEISLEGLELDTSSLSLEKNEETTGVPTPETMEESTQEAPDDSGELTLDLDQIDLSDLVENESGQDEGATDSLPIMESQEEQEIELIENPENVEQDSGIEFTLDLDDALSPPALEFDLDDAGEGSGGMIDLDLSGDDLSMEDVADSHGEMNNSGGDDILDLTLDMESSDDAYESKSSPLEDIVDLSLEDK